MYLGTCSWSTVRRYCDWSAMAIGNTCPNPRSSHRLSATSGRLYRGDTYSKVTKERLYLYMGHQQQVCQGIWAHGTMGIHVSLDVKLYQMTVACLVHVRYVDDITWVKQTVNRRMAKGHGYYLQHAKETCLVGKKVKCSNVLDQSWALWIKWFPQCRAKIHPTADTL